MYYIYMQFYAAWMLIGWHLANDMARSRGTLVLHLVRISYSIILLAIILMYQEYYMSTLGSQRTKIAFCNWLRYFVFVYWIAHSYEERMHVHPDHRTKRFYRTKHSTCISVCFVPLHTVWLQSLVSPGLLQLFQDFLRIMLLDGFPGFPYFVLFLWILSAKIATRQFSLWKAGKVL